MGSGLDDYWKDRNDGFIIRAAKQAVIHILRLEHKIDVLGTSILSHHRRPIMFGMPIVVRHEQFKPPQEKKRRKK